VLAVVSHYTLLWSYRTTNDNGGTVITVDQLIELLQAGKERGTWTGDLPVKISTEFPYHKYAETVERPQRHITNPDCVTIYAEGGL
jgi:hypothetical protein